MNIERQRPEEPTMHSRSQVEEGCLTHEEYLQHADECEWLAEMATLPSNRHALLSAAEMWRKMAADIKSGERRGAVSGDLGE